jgi:phage shock protein E
MLKTIIILLILLAVYLIYTVIKSRLTGLKLEKAFKSGAHVIDVRSPQEYAEGHFSTAINIPYDHIQGRISELGPDKNRPIILYCFAGSRSAAAERTLKSIGFWNVINARNLANLRRFDKNNVR